MADDDDDNEDAESGATEAAQPAAQPPAENPFARFVQPQSQQQLAERLAENPFARFVQQPSDEQPKENPFARFVQKQEQPQEEPSGISSAIRGFAHGILPTAAAVATGAGIGTLVGGPVGTVAGVVGGLLAGAGAGYGQEKLIEQVAPQEAEEYRRAQEAHPYLTGAGEIAAAGPFFGVRAAGTAAEQIGRRALAGAAGAGIDAAQQYALTGQLDPYKSLEAGAGMAVLAGRPTRLGRALGLPGEAPITAGREAATAEPAAAQPEQLALPAPATRYGEGFTMGEPRPEAAPAAPTPEVQGFRPGRPDEAAPVTKDETDIQHGAINKSTTGASETPPAPVNKNEAEPEPATIGVVRSERDLGKEPRAAPGGGVIVGEDPAITAAMRAATETPAVREPVAPTEPAVATQRQQELPQDPTALRGIAASLRRDGIEGRARQFEAAADAIEQQQQQQAPRVAQQAQQIQPGTPEFRPPNRVVQQAPQEQPVPPGLREALTRRYQSVSDEALAAARGRPDLPPGHAEAIANETARRAAPPPEVTGAPPPRGPPPPEPPQGPAAAPPPAGAPQAPLQAATASDLQQGTIASLRRMFTPMVSESAQKARTAIQQAYGPLARLKEQTASRFTDDLHRVANKMGPQDFEKFVDAYETGKTATLPKEQIPLAEALKKNYGDFWEQIKKLPGTEQMEATKDFLTHMYDNTNGAVDKFARDWVGASGGSLRARKYPTFADARAANLKPLSNNPIEHFERYAEGLSHYLGQRQMMADLKSQGRIGYFSPEAVGASGAPQAGVKGAPPEGWSELKMPWAAAGGKRAYAPRDIAETLNQFYNAGLRRAETKDIYDFARQTKNMWTALELGLSAYHATTMVTESLASGMARSLQMASRGPRHWSEAIKQLLTTPAEPITSYLQGRTGRQIYRDPTGAIGTPIQRQIIDTLTKANIQPGNLRATREYDMSQLGNLWDAGKRGALMNQLKEQFSPQAIKDSYGLNIPKHGLDLVRRAMQTISKPLFEHYIPELKLGTMMKDMEAWMHVNPNATDAETLRYAQRVSDSIDNRMGEMNYDNLFMNKTVKDIGMLGLRSFGFTVGGPFREIGAGLGSGARAIAKGQNPLNDPRTAYALAFMPTIAAISAAYQYMRTGKGPEDWRDLVTPKTGGTVKSVGQQVPERILVPGYQKDFLGYFVNPSGPLEEFKAKLAAPWTAILGQMTGEDWRGKPYVPPRATTLEWLQAHAKALGTHLAPISAKQLAEGKKEGSALTLPEQMIGVRTPGAYMLNPKGLEKYLSSQQQRDWRAQEKQENRQRQMRGLPPLPPRPLPQQLQGYQQGGTVADLSSLEGIVKTPVNRAAFDKNIKQSRRSENVEDYRAGSPGTDWGSRAAQLLNPGPLASNVYHTITSDRPAPGSLQEQAGYGDVPERTWGGIVGGFIHPAGYAEGGYVRRRPSK